MFLVDPPPTQFDLRFALFGIPVRVHPFFWLAGAFLVLNWKGLTAAILLVWLVAYFLAILLHELGHAVTIRSYGAYPEITLYGLGGAASYNPSECRRLGTWGQVLISFSGPAAGFLAAALIALGLRAAGHDVEVGWSYYVIPEIAIYSRIGSFYLTLFITIFVEVCIFWGFINLLPIYPLDGGKIARVLLGRYHRDGVRLSLMLSFAVAALMAAIGLLQWKSFFTFVLFGYLAYSNYAELSAYSGRWRW